MRLYEFLSEQELDEISLSPSMRKAINGTMLAGGLATAGFLHTLDNHKQPAPPPLTYEVPQQEIKKTQNQSKTLTPEEIRHQKQEFLDKIIPAAQSANSSIEHLHNQTKKLLSKPHLTNDEQAKLDKLFIEYKVEDRDAEKLLARIQPIPLSLLVAQAAVESGWGKSRLAQSGNVYFGQKTTGDSVIHSTGDHTPYAAFSDIGASVSSYLKNINSNPAYKDMRAARHWFIKKVGRSPTGAELAKFMIKYSTKGKEYTSQLMKVIKTNNLERLD